jgi:RNA polymerase sigma-70 factor (ECF subfamily)
MTIDASVTLNPISDASASGAVARADAAPDAAIVARVLEGDRAAFGVLIDRHEPVVRRVVARIVGAEAADDVVQDAFLRAYHRLPAFRGMAPFRSWLLRIAHNASLDALERGRRAAASVEEEDLETGSPVGATVARTPADVLESRERRERLQAKLRLLPPRHRTVLVLRDVEGLSYEEIADVTETPLGSVKGRLHRARQEFAELLRANTYDWDLPR